MAQNNVTRVGLWDESKGLFHLFHQTRLFSLDIGKLELIEEIGKEQEQFHSRQAFPKALSFANRKGHVFVDFFKLSIRSHEAFGFEFQWFGENLETQ